MQGGGYTKCVSDKTKTHEVKRHRTQSKLVNRRNTGRGEHEWGRGARDANLHSEHMAWLLTVKAYPGTNTRQNHGVTGLPDT